MGLKWYVGEQSTVTISSKSISYLIFHSVLVISYKVPHLRCGNLICCLVFESISPYSRVCSDFGDTFSSFAETFQDYLHFRTCFSNLSVASWANYPSENILSVCKLGVVLSSHFSLLHFSELKQFSFHVYHKLCNTCM